MTKRGQNTAWAVASEGASPKPWQLPSSVEPEGAQMSRIEVWDLPPRFQKMYGNAQMSRQKFATGAGCSSKTSVRAKPKGNVGSKPQHRVSTEAPLSGVVRRGPLPSRPQNGGSINSSYHGPGNAADTQCQPIKAARSGAVFGKATGSELHKATGAHLLRRHDPDVRHGVKGDHFGALRFDCPAGFWTCTRPVASLFWPVSPMWSNCIYPMSVHPLYLGSN
ncbi:uncharacterized protein [Symphalangus syndactylus]|uniref:uncharacterized protein n=1 Tax=Symphalangus syndactylus TaxID=9590 RepID=UPI003003BDAF